MATVQANLLPSHSVKTLHAMKAERTVKRITFNPTEANPGNTLYVSVPNPYENVWPYKAIFRPDHSLI